MARIVDEGPDPHFCIIFQNDVCELFNICAADEQSQVS